MMNNYLHDVATALLLSSGIAMWLMLRRLDDAPATATADYFLRIHRGMTRLAQFSLLWIIIGGIPRVIFYKDFEWANAAGKGQVPALIVKHIVAFICVGSGIYVWVRIRKRIVHLRIRTGKRE